MRSLRAAALLVLVLIAAAACAEGPAKAPPSAPAPLTLARVGFDALPGWPVDDHAAALEAFRRSCARILKLPDDRPMGRTVGGSAGQWKSACQRAGSPDAAAAGARRYFEREFTPYLVRAGEEPKGLFTGYYEPELAAALARDERHDVPLYGRPEDLVTVDLGAFRDAWKGERIVGRVEDGRLVPYPERTAIDAGVLAGKAPVLAFAADPIDAFFLEIQGSGRLALKEGGWRRIGYEVANGRPFVPIGRVLLEEGSLEKGKVSMQAIRAWLAAHPERASAVMQRNPSYVFFAWREGLDDAGGPLGAEGVPLTAGRSLAVDRKALPFGAPLWLDTEAPTGPDGALRPFRRLMIAQDTGGAITGAVRGDIFFGTGAAAGEVAGRMSSTGRYAVLLPKGVSVTR
jgi:membrane-bound lytic murein transglycosylase A